MSPKKTTEDSEPRDDPEARESDAAVTREEHPQEAEARPQPEAESKPETKPPAKTKGRSEGEPKFDAKPAAAKSIAEVMKFDLRARKKRRR